MPSTAVAELRQQLAAVIAGTPSTTPGLPTGMTRLDDLLPGGGIPTGRITEILAAPGLGKTTLARSLVTTTLRRGSAVAWVDATRTLDPRDWITADESVWMVRPPDPARGPWCADLLLRSGAFALVVLDGAPVLPRVVAVRLAQLARESDAALLLLGDGTRASEIGGALRLRLSANAPGQRHPATTITATLEKGGPYSHVQLELGHDIGERIARRLCAHPQVPDRRGVARTRKPEAGGPTSTRSRTGKIRGRRVAQPQYPR
jgi:recombination protein RecA